MLKRIVIRQIILNNNISLRTIPYHCQFSTNVANCSDVRVRFAPSPTGNLHLGGLRTALYNYVFAKSHPNGKFILRIEDTDQNRLIPGITEKIEDMLTWAKLPPDESPRVGGPLGPYIQSERLDLYHECIKKLIKTGHAYKCFCSDIRLKLLRKEQMKNKQRSMYDGNCKHLSEQKIAEFERQNLPYAVRLKLSESPSFSDLVFGDMKGSSTVVDGDPILLKSDGFPTYNFANVIDDHHMDITHVLRGEELLVSTAKHLLIYNAFGWQPPVYAHLPLLKGPDGVKLSKRHGASDIEVYKEGGYSPEAIMNLISYSGGAFQRKNFELYSFTLDELINRFDITCTKTMKTVLEINHLPVFSRNFLMRMLADASSRPGLLTECRNLLSSKYNKESIAELSDDFFIRVLEWDELNISHPKQLIDEKFSYLWADNYVIAPAMPNSDKIMKEFMSLIEKNSVEDIEYLKQQADNIRKSYNTSNRHFWGFLRQLITQRTDGPPLLKLISLLGKERILKKCKFIQQNVE